MSRTLVGLCLWGQLGGRFDYSLDEEEVYFRLRIGGMGS